MGKALFRKYFYFIEWWIVAQNYKFSNKNDLPCAWRNFKKNFTMYETLSKNFADVPF